MIERHHIFFPVALTVRFEMSKVRIFNHLQFAFASALYLHIQRQYASECALAVTNVVAVVDATTVKRS